MAKGQSLAAVFLAGIRCEGRHVGGQRAASALHGRGWGHAYLRPEEA